MSRDDAFQPVGGAAADAGSAISNAERPIALSCEGLWKVFGASPDAFHRAEGPALDDDALRSRNWVPAVRDARFEIAEGEVFVIMGLSGSGKSTLVRCLTRLHEPTAGDVVIQGTNLVEASSRELIALRRRLVGMVFQHFALLPSRTVLGNIAFPLEVQGVGRSDREERARELVSLVGLEGREERFPSELSGGQQQRVGIARSLATDPALWFLDEPFSALDPLIRADLQDELLRLQATLGKTVIFITHDLDEAIKIADRIAIMESGRIVQIGSAEDLVLRPADDYVARFTAKVHPAQVVRLSSLISRSDETPGDGRPFDGRRTVADAAPEILEVESDWLAVARDDGSLGHARKLDVLNVLAGRRARIDAGLNVPA